MANIHTVLSNYCCN